MLPRQQWLLLASLYPAWLAMLVTHEAGHALHAILTGGHIQQITLPLLDFSRTDVAPNPHPQIVAWGGPIWGSLIPLFLLAAARSFNRLLRPAQFFAGFCLLANGLYIAVGAIAMTAGDAHDLLRHAAPLWSLMVFGILTVPSGLYLWHRATKPAATVRPHHQDAAPGSKL